MNIPRLLGGPVSRRDSLPRSDTSVSVLVVAAATLGGPIASPIMEATYHYRDTINGLPNRVVYGNAAQTLYTYDDAQTPLTAWKQPFDSIKPMAIRYLYFLLTLGRKSAIWYPY